MPKLKKKTSKPRNITTAPLMTAPSTPHKATTSLAPVSLLSASPIVAAAEATDAVVTVVADHADLISLRGAHSLPRSVDSSASSVRSAHSSTHTTFDHSTTDQQSTAGTSPTSPSSPSALRALRDRLAADAEAQLHQPHPAPTNSDDSPNKLRKKRPPPSLLAEHQQSSAEEEGGEGEELGQPSVEQEQETVDAAQHNAPQPSPSDSNGANSKDISPIDHSEAYPLGDPTPSSESALFSLALAPPRFARRVASSTTSFAYNTTVRAVHLPIHLARSAVHVPIAIAQSLPVVGAYLNSSSEPTSKELSSTVNSPQSPTEPTTSRKTSSSNMPPRLSRPSEHEDTISPEDDDEFGPKGLLYRTAETAAGVAIAATILPFAVAGLTWGAWVRRGEMKGKSGTSWGKGT